MQLIEGAREATIVERDDGLVTITLHRPERKNALNAPMWTELHEALTAIEVDPTVRALVLTGADGNFSSGADLSGEASDGLTGHGRQLVVQEMRVVGVILNRLKKLPIPTIAAVDGVAVGVGLGIALACDLVIVTDRARLMEVFVKRGLALDGGTSWTLPHLVGLRRAKQIAFFGEPLDAATARSWGLVNEVVPPDALATTAAEWGRKLATGPTAALGLIKTMLEEGEASTFEAALEAESRAQHITYTTDDLREGMTAWMQRRDPVFTGR